MIARWFWAFVLTQALEVPVYLAALARRADPRGHPHEPTPLPRESLRWRLGFAFLPSMATHPYVWFVIPALFASPAWTAAVAQWPGLAPWRYALFFALAEAFAVLAEALLLRALRVPRALLWSLAANATSAGIGLALGALGWL